MEESLFFNAEFCERNFRWDEECPTEYLGEWLARTISFEIMESAYWKVENFHLVTHMMPPTKVICLEEPFAESKRNSTHAIDFRFHFLRAV